MYHINHEGKVYPCRAKVRSCPYGEDSHAQTEKELYYKSMRFSPDVSVPQSVDKEIETTGRLKSLYALSDTIERVPYPIESIVKNLEHSLKEVRDNNPEIIEKQWDKFAERAAHEYALTKRYNNSPDFYIPPEIRTRGREIFENTYGGLVTSNSGYDNDAGKGVRALSKLRDMEDTFDDYEEYKRFGLTEENKEGSVHWMEEDFYQFSHDLNTSKMLTRPIFYGNIEEAKEKIKTLDDYELLGTYDDYLTSDEEIMENVRMANNFDYSPRADLSREANINVKKWYDRNKSIVSDWVKNTPKRVLLSMEMANELDRRGIFRQENAIGKK